MMELLAYLLNQWELQGSNNIVTMKFILIILLFLTSPFNLINTGEREKMPTGSYCMKIQDNCLYYDFDPFNVKGLRPIKSLKNARFPFIEIANKSDTLIITNHIESGYSFARKLIKEKDYYFGIHTYQDDESGNAEITHQTFYTKNYILDFGFLRNLLDHRSKSNLMEITLFTRAKKESISFNQEIDVKPTVDFDIGTIKEEVIATRRIDEFKNSEKYLMINSTFIATFTEKNSHKYFFDNFRFHGISFSYYWYVLLPSFPKTFYLELLEK